MNWHKLSKTGELFFLILLGGCLLIDRVSAASSPQIILDPVFKTELSALVDLKVTGVEGDDRWFTVHQGGDIFARSADGELLGQFLDLSASVSGGYEQGLLGLAFHPNYAENRQFFVDYTDLNGDTMVVRYTTSADNPNQADISSAKQILKVFQPSSNHNGGGLIFGPDGYLYIGLGDGGAAGDPGNYGQDNEDLLGAILRIDVDGGDPYTIPSDNPFVNKAGADEVWVYGLRNPWRFSFDRLTGDLFIGDVGQGLWEEINFVSAESGGGQNFGWRCYEAFAQYNYDGCLDSSAYTFPIYDYYHSDGQSVTGGYVYRGVEFPELTGFYFFADFAMGQFWSAQYMGDQKKWIVRNLLQYKGNSFSTFGEDRQGELYLATFGGEVYRITSYTMVDTSLPFHIYLPVIQR